MSEVLESQSGEAASVATSGGSPSDILYSDYNVLNRYDTLEPCISQAQIALIASINTRYK